MNETYFNGNPLFSWLVQVSLTPWALTRRRQTRLYWTPRRPEPALHISAGSSRKPWTGQKNYRKLPTSLSMMESHRKLLRLSPWRWAVKSYAFFNPVQIKHNKMNWCLRLALQLKVWNNHKSWHMITKDKGAQYSTD